MTRDDIIRMAREADPGFEGGPDADGTMPDSLVGIDAIERFAALVAAAEREACARVVDGNIAASTPGSRLHDILMSNAAAIRARSTP